MTAADVLVTDDQRTFAFPAVYARSATDGVARLAERPWRKVWLDYSLGNGETIGRVTSGRVDVARARIGSNACRPRMGDRFQDTSTRLRAEIAVLCADDADITHLIGSASSLSGAA